MTLNTLAPAQFTIDRNLHQTRLERVFDAPCDFVWKIYTDPELLPKWWGPAELTTVVDVMELKQGGRWRFLQYEADGTEHPFSGQYLQVEAPHLLVQTFCYEPMGEESSVTETTHFETINDGRTRIVSITQFKTGEDLEQMAAEGMELGAVEGFERLNTLILEQAV